MNAIERGREREKQERKHKYWLFVRKTAKQHCIRCTHLILFGLLHFGMFMFHSKEAFFFARCAPFCCVCVFYYIHWFSGSIPELFTLLYKNWQSIFTHCAFCNVYFFPFIYYLLLNLPTFCWRCNYRSITFEWMCLCRCFALCKNSILKAI